MTKLILIRHGETDYNLENRYCGFSNPSLNKKGIWQSRKLTNRFANIKVKKVYSSDLKRAVETTKIIFTPLDSKPRKTSGLLRGKHLMGFKNNSIEQLPDFREMNFGIFEGLRYDEIVKKHSRLYKNWINNPTKAQIPDGEALQDLVKRVRKRLAFLLSCHKDGKIVLVAHGGPIRVILCAALKFGLDSFWKIKQDTAAINIINYPKGSSPIVVKINDTSHLTTPEAATV